MLGGLSHFEHRPSVFGSCAAGRLGTRGARAREQRAKQCVGRHKDYPITGTGAPNGADTIATKRVDANTFESTLKKAGKVVLTTRAVYTSTLRTITSKGTTENGQATNNVSVYDRQ